MVPYLGIVLNEIAGLVEVQPTVIEDNLVNFSKMRRVSFVTKSYTYSFLVISFSSFVPVN